MKRDLLELLDIKESELFRLLGRTAELKRAGKGNAARRPLSGKSIGLIFEKRSTRTRLSFEVGIAQMGGQPIFMSPDQMQLSRGEPVKDTARVLSRYLDGVVIRNDSHDDLREFARWSTVPVINALTNLYHPCQVFSDLFTIKEAGGNLAKMKLAFVGDPNNIFNSWMNAAAMIGFHLTLASPKGYGPDREALKCAQKRGEVRMQTYKDPAEAVKGADVIYTDVWVSMGQEKNSAKKRNDFAGFTIDRKLLKAAAPNALVLHCLPAHRGEEITDEVMENFADLIFTQAENRLHGQKALMEFFFKK